MGKQSVLQKRKWANYQIITRYGTIAHDTRDTSHIRVIYKMMPNAIDRPSGLPTAQTAAVEQAYRAGVLTLSEYQAKMAENYTPSPQNSPASTLVAGVKQMTYEGAWRTMAEYPDYPAALEAVKCGISIFRRISTVLRHVSRVSGVMREGYHLRGILRYPTVS